jgi:hypothetical protein
MKLSTIISQARSGELKSLSSKDKTDEVIVNYINLALIALYSRFTLRTEEAVIALTDVKTLYRLDGMDEEVTVNGAPIEDDNVLKILSAFDERGEISINDENNPLSIYTPSYNTLQVPHPETGAYIAVIYKAGPNLITYVDDGSGNATEATVQLPMHLLEPLLHYVGYRAHGSGTGDIDNESNSHLSRYVASCNNVESLGLIPTDSVDMDNSRKGFQL